MLHIRHFREYGSRLVDNLGLFFLYLIRALEELIEEIVEVSRARCGSGEFQSLLENVLAESAPPSRVGL